MLQNSPVITRLLAIKLVASLQWSMLVLELVYMIYVQWRLRPWRVWFVLVRAHLPNLRRL